jgi:hypothetical protein
MIYQDKKIANSIMVDSGGVEPLVRPPYFILDKGFTDPRKEQNLV